MGKMLLTISMFGIALALVLAMGANSITQAQQMRVDRDLGEFHINDANQFGDDRAYSSVMGTDRDADYRAYVFAPETYGLMGDYGNRSGGGGGGN